MSLEGEVNLLEVFLDWVWARHHNVLSWYIRPFFVLPYCYFAYKRKLGLLVLTLLLFPTTLFWFPAPDVASEKVLQYLNWEREFLVNGNSLMQTLLILLVIGFLWLLAMAFWKKSILLGVIVLNAGTALKIIWSIFFGGAVGYAAILPSIVTMIICNIAVYAYWRWRVNTNTT